MYRVFTRNFYRRTSSGLEADTRARKRTIDHVHTEEEARELCREWNATHKPGPLSRKAEYTYE